MKYTVAAYYDLETEKFNPPMLFPFDVDATLETIKSGVIKGKIEGAEAFDCMLLGTFDTETGLFALLEKPKKLLHLKDYVRSEA